MNPASHFLIGWLTANIDSRLNRKERAIITLSGVVPDIDGLGIIADFITQNTEHPLQWWGRYHHMLGHNLGFGLLVTGVSFILATRRWKTAALAFFSYHLHLLGDIVGARGDLVNRCGNSI